MKNKILTIITGLLLTGTSVFAQMVLDNNGYVGLGTATPTAVLDVIGLTDDDAVAGETSGTGVGVYGKNTSSGNIGYLGDSFYGVYGYSPGGYAGYFQGDAWITYNT